MTGERPPIQPPPTGHKPVIGLLGAPGAGKSYVARHFEARGAAVIDADALARQALDEPGVRDQLVAWWGESVLDGQGRIDRQEVGRIVFRDPTALARLEGLTHPLVNHRRHELRNRYQADPSVTAIVEDCPLLLEKGLAGPEDFLVYVEADRLRRLNRVRQQRGWDEARLDRREENQWPLDIKRERADYIVINQAGEADRGEADMASQVGRVLSLILQKPKRAV